MPPGLFRLLLALTVVIHHSFPLRMGGWAVGMFFVLSGYWIASMWKQKYCQAERPYTTFLATRWWRLAPLFITVQFFAAVLAIDGFPLGGRSVALDWKWWLTQPLIAGSSQFGRLLPPAWSLDVEMQFYLVAPILIMGAMQLRRGECILLMLALSCWGTLQLLAGATLETARLDVFAFLFLAGVLVRRFEWKPSLALQKSSAIALAILITVVFCVPSTRELVWRRGVSTTEISATLSTLFFMTTCLVAIPLAVGTVYRECGPRDRWMGDLSYPLYLFHWMPRDWYYANVDMSQPAWQKAAFLMANFSVAIIGAIILLHLVDRPAQRLRSRWLKRRISRRPAVRDMAVVNA